MVFSQPFLIVTTRVKQVTYEGGRHILIYSFGGSQSKMGQAVQLGHLVRLGDSNGRGYAEEGLHGKEKARGPWAHLWHL